MKTFGLIGKNIDYSFSRTYFKNKFSEMNLLNHQYLNFDIDSLLNINNLFNSNNFGFNVTIPYKEAIIPYLDELDGHAEKIGAVNTIKLKDNKTVGYNTDWLGFKNSIKPLLQNHHNNALILGTGGASKAIKYALEQLNISYKVVSRNNGDYNYDGLNEEIIRKYQIIINCTPLGTFPIVNLCPNIPYNAITPKHLVYDLIYNPSETLFLKKAKEQGAIIKNGLEMLEIQAEKAWEIWNS